MLVKAGSTLLVPRGEHRQADVPVEIADNATMALAPDGPSLRKVSLKAGRKDSVASIAKRYRVSAAQVAQWNQVGAAASFAPGQTVVVYVAARAVHAPSGHPSTRAASATRNPVRVAAAKAPARSARN